MKNKTIIGIIIALVVIGIVCGIVYKYFTNSSEISNTTKEISIVVYDKDSKEIFNKKINTDAKYLSEALEKIEDLNIQMQDGEYGKYITSIQGISEAENYFWSYYINDEYATVGVSSCEIQDGYIYTFKIEEFVY